ncbi:MAG: hypothetical protein ACLQPD_02135 [Desulfomonilaceae bacterium]
MNDLTQRLTFHDLRHCAINNLRLAGNDYFKIMAIAVQKTMNVFKRYNLVTEEELRSIVWQDQAGGSAPIDTYMDTKRKMATRQWPQLSISLARPAGLEPATYGLEVREMGFSPTITHRYKDSPLLIITKGCLDFVYH